MGFSDRVRPQKDTPPIITDLNALRDKSRLCIHVWEVSKIFEPPAFSFGHLSAVPADKIQEGLLATDEEDKTKIPLMSASLLPTTASGKSLRPYMTQAGQICHMAYLIDLRQVKNAPKVITAEDSSSFSGREPLEKIFELECNFDHALDRIYDQAGGSKVKWLRLLGGSKGAEISNKLLDALGAHYESIDILDSSKDNIWGLSEVLIAASLSHIKAICVSYFVSENPPNWYDPMMRLCGALGGLQNLSLGLDVPVVFYHVNPPRRKGEAKQNSFTYLGQERNELTKVAIKAIKDLNKLGISNETKFLAILAEGQYIEPPSFNILSKNIKQELGGIDIGKPLSDQKTTVEALLGSLKPEGRSV